jgi:hypothetical protein
LRPLILLATLIGCVLLAAFAVQSGRFLQGGELLEGVGGSKDVGDRPGASSTAAAATLPADGVARAASWLARHTADGTEIAVPRLWKRQLQATLPGRKVTARPGPRTDLLVIGRDAVPGAGSDTLRRLWGSSDQVAVFGGRVQVRQVLGAPFREVRDARREAGRRLVADTDIRLTPQAWSTLVRGDVDVRVMTLLRRWAVSRTIDIAAFPRDSTQRMADAPARRMSVTAIDGVLVDDSRAPAQLRAQLLAQPPGLIPHSVTRRTRSGSEVLVVSFALPTETP